jgi:pimeloyl-ACP methyl ester carboxylesterase
MAHQSDNQIKLRDSRCLGYAEFGNPRGKPFLFFHGYPGSRWDGAETGHAAERVGVRLIAPDRPGMGLSDYQPNRRLLDWPKDVLVKNNIRLFQMARRTPWLLRLIFSLNLRMDTLKLMRAAVP